VKLFDQLVIENWIKKVSVDKSKLFSNRRK
jgi:hypothetical protein